MPKPKPLDKRCPKCGALATQKCRLPSGTVRPDPHDERIAAVTVTVDRGQPPLRVETFDRATGEVVQSIPVGYHQAERTKGRELGLVDRDEFGVRIVDQHGQPW